MWHSTLPLSTEVGFLTSPKGAESLIKMGSEGAHWSMTTPSFPLWHASLLSSPKL